MRALPHEGIDERRACIEQVFAVIEQQQEPPVLEMFDECRRDGLPRFFVETKHRRRGPRHEARVGKRRQLDQPGAV